MKYKYKQIIFSVTAVVMVVGLAVFSTKPTNAGKANESDIAVADNTAPGSEDNENKDPESTLATEPSIEVTEPSTASESAIDVKEPEVKEFKANNNQEVTDLITEYLLGLNVRNAGAGDTDCTGDATARIDRASQPGYARADAYAALAQVQSYTRKE